jgi:hypothetical protein
VIVAFKRCLRYHDTSKENKYSYIEKPERDTAVYEDVRSTSLCPRVRTSAGGERPPAAAVLVTVCSPAQEAFAGTHNKSPFYELYFRK